MPRKPQHCLNCGARCFGTRCMACSHTHGERKREPPRPHWPTSSWWAESRDFYADAKQAALRMASGDGVAYTPKHSGI